MSDLPKSPLLDDPANFSAVEQCTLCGGSKSTEQFREGPFRVVRCDDCSLVYVTPRLRHEVLPEVYNEDYWSSKSPKERGYADYRSQAPLYLKTFKKRLALVERFRDQTGHALDVGCAAGFFLKILHDAGWKVEGVELSPAIASHARDVYGFEQVHVGPIETANYAEKSFDLITMWDVIEHVPEPIPFLETTLSLLKDDGIFILETQNVESKFAKRLGPKWHHYKHLEHLYHFSPKTIERLLDAVGMEVLHLTPKFGGKHVSIEFVRERAVRVHGAMKWALLPLAPLNKMSFYVNMKDEMIVVARKKRSG
ncbi:MAG: class I SAM-dependent methyltransferase [Planctomycetes bacterium]|nr:class I SAM-dependent methyltransferase [Planctomycetota bacterium]MCB9918442.1 class I SAM-dependent methyltransferase [Planctomycetota bacterium]